MKYGMFAFGFSMCWAGGALAQAPASDLSEPLRLECPGQVNMADSITDANNNDVEIDQKTGANVQVEISGETGRVRMPRKMTSLFNRGDDYWFEMSNFKVAPDRIVADVRMTMIRTKSLEIDRRTGNIKIERGPASFFGRCDLAPTTNRF